MNASTKHEGLLALATATALAAGCATAPGAPGPAGATPAPDPRSFTGAPLRNRIRVALDAPAEEVWALVGNLDRLPEYSAGLERVEVRRDTAGRPAEYVCHFRPIEEGAAGIVHRERFGWYEPGRGWASTGAEPVDAFGVRNSLHVVTLDVGPHGTTLNWAAYYDAEDLASNRASMDQALGDIADRLIARFGGRLLERYRDPGASQGGPA